MKYRAVLKGRIGPLLGPWFTTALAATAWAKSMRKIHGRNGDAIHIVHDGVQDIKSS